MRGETQYQRYSDRKFKEWKHRVSKHLPDMVQLFYAAVSKGMYVDYEMHARVGRVIMEINNPFYTIKDGGEFGERITERNSVMALEICLQISVESCFAFINTKCKKYLQSKAA